MLKNIKIRGNFPEISSIFRENSVRFRVIFRENYRLSRFESAYLRLMTMPVSPNEAKNSTLITLVV